MRVIIAGGGNTGKTIATKLINEGHDITIIEKISSFTKKLQHELDALVIKGQAETIPILLEANVKKSVLLIAVTRDDNVNIVISTLAKKLNPNITVMAQITHADQYFKPPHIRPQTFGIDYYIDPLALTVEKILTVIQFHNVLEMLHYEQNRVSLVGVRIDERFAMLDKSIQSIRQDLAIFRNILIIAIYRNDQVIIPDGDETIRERDKVFFIGNSQETQSIIKTYFRYHSKIENVVITGGSDIAVSLAARLLKQKKSVTIIEGDKETCNYISETLEKVHVLHGSGNDESILAEVDMKKACFVAASRDDEYNIIASVSAKRIGAVKAISVIRNNNLVPIVNSMPAIDSVFSPSILSIGRILSFCRIDNIISVTQFSQINAESIEVSIDGRLPIIDKTIGEIEFPQDMKIGVIVRGSEIIIPSGETVIRRGDRAIIFLFPDSIHKVQKMFSKPALWGN